MCPTCVICWENLEDGKKDVPDGYPIAVLPCCHVFHHSCLREFFTSRKTATTGGASSQGSSDPGASTAITGPCPFCGGLTILRDAKRLYFSVDATARSKAEVENRELKAKIVDLELENDLAMAKLVSVISNHATEKAQLLENLEVERKRAELIAVQQSEILVGQSNHLKGELLGDSDSTTKKRGVARASNSFKGRVSKKRQGIPDQKVQIGSQQEESVDAFLTRVYKMISDDDQLVSQCVAASKRMPGSEDEDDSSSPRPGSSSMSSSRGRKCAKLSTPTAALTMEQPSVTGEYEDDDEIQIIFQSRHP